MKKKKARFVVESRAARTELGRAVAYELEKVRCNNPRCRRCRSSTKAPHGPYWYARWRELVSGRLRKRYIGRTFRELTDAELLPKTRPSSRKKVRGATQ